MSRMSPKLRSSLTLVGLFILFMLPAIAAYYVYYNRASFHFNTNNIGELVIPPLDFTQFKVPRTEKDKWVLGYLQKGECDDACKLNIQKLASVHYSLGQDSLNVSELVLLEDTPITRDFVAHTKSNNDQHIALADVTGISSKILNNSTHASSEDSLFFIVDPKNNLLMQYPKNIEGHGILRDMKKLLKVANG